MSESEKMVRVEAQDNIHRIHMSDELSVYTAAQVFDEISPLITSEEPVEIYLSEVTDIDTAGLQLLMLIKREREKIDFPVYIAEHSKASMELFELLHLNTYFEG